MEMVLVIIITAWTGEFYLWFLNRNVEQRTSLRRAEPHPRGAAQQVRT